jgi:hypothetical protein
MLKKKVANLRPVLGVFLGVFCDILLYALWKIDSNGRGV